ncbi:MAG: mannose-1-phosphate guanylyltransferase/mannose-6-phosphate isomerase [Pseudomonadota bacterium]
MSDKAGQVYPVIMCGGSGTRLWPLSRRSYPKQFSALFPGGSLFERTLGRLDGLGWADPVLMTNQEFRFVAAEQLSNAGHKATRIVIEPAARNTAPAICAAAEILAATDPDAVMLVLPSDHLMGDVDAFHVAARHAVDAARDGHLVTFGIKPDRPETGYGYVELAEAPGQTPLPFVRFVEKPDQARAEEMLASGRFLWNAGMFAFSVRAILDAFDAHASEVRTACAASVATGAEDLCFFRLGEATYATSPDISIDYAIMEQVQGMIVPVDCGWNDLGSWRTVWQESAQDDSAVATEGGAVAIDCQDSLLRSEHPDMRVVGIGLQNTVAVAMRDAVLIADMDRAQDVRIAVETLRATGAAQATEFPRVHRPWGWYETVALGERFQVKQIMVLPGGQLSLQSHVHRSEHWVVVAGSARVTVDEDVRLLTENESIYIPLGAVHRLENPGKLELHLIEVQSGAYLGEDDIIRYEDVYART